MASEETLRQAIEALRIGNQAQARRLLDQLIQNEPSTIDVWLWAAAANDDAAQKRAYLQRALRIDPQDQRARVALERLGESLTATELATPPTPKTAHPLAKPNFAPTSRRRRIPVVPLLAIMAVILLLVPLSMWLF